MTDHLSDRFLGAGRTRCLAAVGVVAFVIVLRLAFGTGFESESLGFIGPSLVAALAIGWYGGYRAGLLPADPHPAHLGLFAAAYFLVGGLGQGLALIPGVAIIFWPPAGLFLAILLLNPRSHWPSYILAGCLAELACNEVWFHNPIPFALAYFTANALEALTAAWLIDRFLGRPLRIESFSDAAAFTVLGAMIAPAVGATIIATIDAFRGKHPFATAWPLVWLGDGTGLLVSAPLALTAVRAWRERERIAPHRLLEAIALGLLLVGVAALAYRGWLPTPFVTMPFVLWASARFYVPGAAVAVSLLTLTSAIFTVTGAGEFSGSPAAHQKIVMLQVFIGVSAVSALLTATLSMQRQQALRSLREWNRDLEQRVRERTADARVWRDRYEAAARASGHILYDSNLDSRQVAYGGDCEGILGFTAEELGGDLEKWLALIHPDDLPRFSEAIRATTEADMEYRLRRRDGSYVVVRDNGHAVADQNGQLHMIGFVKDVTERRRAELAIRESEHRLRLAMESSATGLWDWDLQTNAVVWSPECYHIHGVNAGEFDGTAAGFDRLVHPDDRARFWSTVRTAGDRHSKCECEYRILRPAGEVRWVANLGRALYDDERQPIRMIGTITDITERKQAEEEVRRRAEEFQVLLDTLPVGIFVAQDEECRTITGNRAAQELLRTPSRNLSLSAPEAELPTHFRVYRNGTELPVDQLPVQRAARGEIVVNEELELVFNDGTVVIELISASPLYDHDGRPRGAVATVLDITARKQAEVECERVMSTLNNLIASAPLGIALLDAEMRFLHINEPLAEMNGLPLAAHLGKTVAEIVPVLYDSVRPVFEQVLRTGEPVPDFILEGETLKTPGAKRVWQESWFPVAGVDGRPSGVGVILQEITEQRRLEQEREDAQRTLFTLVEQCPFGIYIVDDEFRMASINVRSQNKAFANVRPLVGRPFDEAMRILWPEPIATECINIFQHTLATGEPYFSKDFLGQRADSGQTEGYEWETHRITLPGGRYGVVCYYFDSTKLRQVEQALKDADRKKDEFLATLAHELRNPLAPIRNGLQILKLVGNDPAAAEQSRAMMERQVEQMTRLIDDLMDVSRISQGKIQLQRTRMPLADAVRNAVETSRPLIEARGHTLVTDVPPEPIYVEGDLTRLSQVFANLLNNAAKYTDEGGHIRLAIELQGYDVLVRVSDNGVGIPDQLLNQIFEMFVQVNSSQNKSQGGLGIGLNIVQRLVGMHGGSITAESRGQGQGSTFTVRLPVMQSCAAEHSDSPALPPLDHTCRRILVVDDNCDAANSLAMMLRMIGNETQIAYDGQEAVDAAASFLPDVILMDIGMPNLNGYEACRRIREQPWGKSVILVACTGWGQEEDKRRSSEAGFDLHMTKPINTLEFAKMLPGLAALAESYRSLKRN